MRYALSFALLVTLALQVVACSSDSESTPDACEPGQACPCSSDADCPDLVAEFCSAAQLCLPRPAVPDVSDDTGEELDVVDVTEDAADVGQELIDQIRDTTDEQLIEDNTSSCEERCAYAQTCSAPEPFTPEGCAAECADLNGSIAEVYGDSPGGRDCLEGIALLDACLLALDCETFIAVEYAGSDEDPCATVQETAAASCDALFGEGG